MPELPEVETTRRGIGPHLIGHRITDVCVRQRALRWPLPDNLESLLRGQTPRSIDRRGKYLLLRFDKGTLLWHLGMSGSLRLVPASEPPGKHDHIDCVLATGLVLRFQDPRRFGAVLWTRDPVDQHPLLTHLGPEPLSSDFDGTYLHGRASGRKQAVKSWLMDAKVVVGVGNIYANEALFASGIHPLKAAGKLSRARCDHLVADIKNILERAIAQGGTTLRDFVGGDGKPGYFAQSLTAYGRGGQPCTRCAKPLTEKYLAQRSTVYCTHCQT